MATYNIEKNIDKIRRGSNTFFIEQKDFNKIKNKLKQSEYNIFKIHDECNKVLLYTNKKPEVVLYEIKSKIPLRHQDILGTIYSLNINDEMFGDIIVDNDKYYIVITKTIEKYIRTNLLSIRNSLIELEEKDIDYLKEYKQQFEEYEIIVSSLRIDTVISTIIHTNRKSIEDKIKDKEILLNYEYLNKMSYVLKENDIFSIRKYGKFKFIGIIKNTKKDNYVIKYLKYV